ncbi:hypothetical protein C1H46_020198 [Malus baccata]|uniref:Uncharacterized protein n=1 Tax=Malus baccata TaxID=106549 RepID=A0A540M5X0_MALBA|nr:hypothetical protein C1H46_020198 [Malus baccata]
MAMVVAVIVFVSLFLFVFLAIKFATADGDFTLTSKGGAKRDQIEDKVVWITGASRGIGEILAKQLAKLGAKLIISARNEAELERVKRELTGKHVPDGVKVLPLDLASGEDHLKDAVEKAESFFLSAGVDYMIHNAAVERPVGEGEIVPPPERSFWAKYWMYLIPLGLIVMNAITQAMNMAEEGAGQPAGQAQQPAAVQRGSSSAVRRR